MTQVVIATHGILANGLKSSTEFIMGEQKNLHAIPAYTEECRDVNKAISDLLYKYNDESIVFVTDILGGSVNTDVKMAVGEQDNRYLISGCNLPLIIQLIIDLQTMDPVDAITKAVSAGKEGIVIEDDDSIRLEDTDSGFDSF